MGGFFFSRGLDNGIGADYLDAIINQGAIAMHLIINLEWLAACGLERWANFAFPITSRQRMPNGETMYHVTDPDGRAWAVAQWRGVREVA